MCAGKSVTTFLDIDEDCLLKICEYLTIRETFALIGIFGERFDSIAYRRIAQLKQLTLNFRELPDYTETQLEVIGSNLKRFECQVGYSIPNEHVLTKVRACMSASGRRLEAVTLNYIHFNAEYAACLNTVASQLKRLDLSFCLLTDELLAPVLERCVILEELIILGNYTLCGESLRAIKTPKLLKKLVFDKHGRWTLNMAEFFKKVSQTISI